MRVKRNFRLGKEKMKFSIIVPVHNNENYIESCVKSLVSQNRAIEIILVENNSTDNSANICQKLASEKANIIYHSTTIKGVSNARNEGLKLATGDIIGFCDGDDNYEPSVLEKIEKAFIENAKIDIVITGYSRCSKDKKTTLVYPKSKIISAQKAFSLTLNDERVLGSVCNKFFRKSALDGILFDENLIYCEDTHFVTRVLNKNLNAKCYILSTPTYCYNANENSVTNSKDKIFDKDNNSNVINALKKIRLECNLTKKLDNELSYAIVKIATYILMAKLADCEQKLNLEKEIKINKKGFKKLLFKYALKSTFDLKLAIRRWQLVNKIK